MNKIPAILLALFAQFTFSQTIWDGEIDTDWYTSNASASEFTISTAGQLAGLAKLVNEGNTFVLQYVILGADIMLNDTTNWKNWENGPPANKWIPIGTYTETTETEDKSFLGLFKGSGYTISGIYIDNSSDYQGLFGHLPGDVIELGVTASYIKGRNNVGGMAGYTNRRGGIRDSYFTGVVMGQDSVGGLVGKNDYSNYGKYSISNSYFVGVVTGRDHVGGLVGNNNISVWRTSSRYIIDSSYSSGVVTGRNNVGGLIGYNDGGNNNNNGSTGSVNECYFIGTVTGQNDVGGLVGRNYSDVGKSYFAGNVTGQNDVGGLVGGNYSDVRRGYSVGTVSGTSYVGGLVGFSDISSNIIHSYSINVVSGDSYVGGLIGKINGGNLNNCYSAGRVEGVSNVGGLIGGRGSVFSGDYNYYDREASGQSNSSGGLPKTTAEMKRSSTFHYSWYFGNIWGINDIINDGYPYLMWREDKLCTEAGHIYIGEVYLGVCKTEEQICEETEGMVWGNGNCKTIEQAACEDSNGMVWDNGKCTTPIFIQQILGRQIRIQTISNGIIIENLPRNAEVQIYNLQGEKVYSGNSGNYQVLKIMIHTNGMYIVKAENQTFRIAVR